MNLKKISLLFLLFLVNIYRFQAQNSLRIELSYEEIERKIDNANKNTNDVWNYIDLYIKKSKKEKNSQTLLYAYRYASVYSEYPKNLKYADSAIFIAKRIEDKTLLTTAYINRGHVYMNIDDYQKALDDILIANQFAKETGDNYNYYKTIYFIAQNKIYLGQYEDANKELAICIKYFKDNANKSSLLGTDYQMFYMYSLMSYIDSNTKLGKQKGNIKLLSEAFDYIKKNNLSQFKPYFISIEGTDAYYFGNYKDAITKLTTALKLYNNQYTHITEIYYIGMSYWKMGKQNIAVKYFEEIDRAYEKSKKLDPQFRTAYELLIKYNEKIGNKDKQLEYINKLMSLDNLYEKNYKYLYTKINKEYDTKKLIAEKTRIENSLKTRNYIILSLILLTITTISFLGYRYYTLQKKYELIFKKLVSENPFNNNFVDEKLTNSNNFEVKSLENYSIPKNSIAITNPQTDFYQKIPGMNPTLVESILNQLQEFEMEEGFLNPQVSQKLLSENFGTNSTYLSKIINVYKGKNFNTYINDLKLDYILNLLKTDRKYLNKDVKELSQISGFLNPENFSDNFQRKFGIKPSFFIKKMKENIEINDIEN